MVSGGCTAAVTRFSQARWAAPNCDCDSLPRPARRAALRLARLPHLRGIRQIANRHQTPADHAATPIAVADDVADGVAESAQAEWLADDEGVRRDRKDQGIFSGLLQHLVELVDHHLGELPTAPRRLF